MAQWPFKGKFDVIFCRNVVIYFDEPTQMKIWSRFAELLPEGSHLYIGHSERVSGDAKNGLRQYRHHHLPLYDQGLGEAAHDHGRTRSCRRRFSHHAWPDHGSASQSDPDVDVIGQAADAMEAREAIKHLNPDVITLDIEMPNMNGLEFLEKIMRLRPMPVIMVSTLTHKRRRMQRWRRWKSARFDCVGKPCRATHAPVRRSGRKGEGRGPLAAQVPPATWRGSRCAATCAPTTAPAARSSRSVPPPAASKP
jgi:CheY-like chemotaxis protein